MKTELLAKAAVVTMCFCYVLPQPAVAYVGPGAGLSAIGTFVAVVAGVIVALFGFVWYPIKRLRRKWKQASVSAKGGSAG